MSDHSHSPHGQDDHGHKSEDEIAYGKVIAVGVASLAVFALSTVWAAALLSHESKKNEETTGLASHPPRVVEEEVGIVDQVPFAADKRLARWKAEHAARLNGYGWVDRSRGIAHIPIERAMEAVAGGASPSPLPSPSPTGAPR